MPSGSPFGQAKNVSASEVTQALPCSLVGFYVNSTTAGTIVIHDSNSGSVNNAITGTITPAVGWHKFPVSLNSGLRVVIGGTLNVTLIYQP